MLGRFGRRSGSMLGSAFGSMSRSIRRRLPSNASGLATTDDCDVDSLLSDYAHTLSDQASAAALPVLPVYRACECSQDAAECFARDWRWRERLWQTREPCVQMTTRVVGRRVSVQPSGARCRRQGLWGGRHQYQMGELELHDMYLCPRTDWAGVCDYEYRFCCEDCWPDEFYGSWDQTARHHYERFCAHQQAARWNWRTAGERFDFAAMELPAKAQCLLPYYTQPSAGARLPHAASLVQR
jgi:hypothetical protein